MYDVAQNDMTWQYNTWDLCCVVWCEKESEWKEEEEEE
jgi:hypothetical protein